MAKTSKDKKNNTEEQKHPQQPARSDRKPAGKENSNASDTDPFKDDADFKRIGENWDREMYS